jgi:large subunit ribosomal protein L6
MAIVSTSRDLITGRNARKARIGGKFYVKLLGKCLVKMSRIGKQLINIPKKVRVKLNGHKILVSGPKGNLCLSLPTLVHSTFNADRQEFSIEKEFDKGEKGGDMRLSQELFGISRTLVENMIQGVSNGFEKRLQIKGVGYRVQLDGKDLLLNLGYSHPVKMVTPPGLKVSVENSVTIIVFGIQKDVVGEFAAKIRSVRPPEPYKGKGVAYEGESIRLKAGKTGK